MKLLSFTINDRASWGAAVEGGIIDLREITGFNTLLDAIAANALGQLPAKIAAQKPHYRQDEIRFLPVIPRPPKVLCIGTNYHEHRIETGRDVSEYPVVFARFANSQVGHEEAIQYPQHSVQLDFEGEIAVIIGTGGRDISEEKSWDHIAGYAAYNDATVRDWQRHTHQWTPGKNHPASGGFGPWMVTRDEIADGADISLCTRLNGVEVQRSSAALMIFSIPALIAYCSKFTELEAGDVIVTGTPGGVGGKRNPQLWMKPGDVVEIEVEKIGILRNPIK